MANNYKTLVAITFEGDLKNPGVAIPKGSISAASFALATFIIILLLCSFTVSKCISF